MGNDVTLGQSRFLFGWLRLLLRIFGVKLGNLALLYLSARIWAPWNLEIGDHGTLAHGGRLLLRRQDQNRVVDDIKPA